MRALAPLRAVMGKSLLKMRSSGRKDSPVKGGVKGGVTFRSAKCFNFLAKTRKRQDSNLRGLSPFDFESNPLTARARLLRMDIERSMRICNLLFTHASSELPLYQQEH